MEPDYRMERFFPPQPPSQEPSKLGRFVVGATEGGVSMSIGMGVADILSRLGGRNGLGSYAVVAGVVLGYAASSGLRSMRRNG